MFNNNTGCASEKDFLYVDFLKTTDGLTRRLKQQRHMRGLFL